MANGGCEMRTEYAAISHESSNQNEAHEEHTTCFWGTDVSILDVAVKVRLDAALMAFANPDPILN